MVTAISCKISQILLHEPIPRPICGSTSVRQRPFRVRCHSIRSDYSRGGDRYTKGDNNPVGTLDLIRVAVSGATELLKDLVWLDRLGDAEELENLASSVDDVVRILKLDYEKDYLVNGVNGRLM